MRAVAAVRAEGEHISWLTIPNQEQSVLEDVQRIRNHPLVPGDIPVYGYIYDVQQRKVGRGTGRHCSRPGAIAMAAADGGGWHMQPCAASPRAGRIVDGNPLL